MNNSTLLIIPCCKRKQSGGYSLPIDYQDPLQKLISPEHYSYLLKIREEFANHIKNDSFFMQAVERYSGNFYKSFPKLSNCIKSKTNKKNTPKLLILSALYGPLHPYSLINDYELKMPNTKKALWRKSFPFFLENYVRKNNITQIRFYCGKSTGYYSVIKNSFDPLLGAGILKKVIHYNVRNGGSSTTPKNHGRQLAFDLSCGKKEIIFDRVVEKFIFQ